MLKYLSMEADNRDMTPCERNRIRHLRELLSAYETHPRSAILDAIQRTARELADVGHVAIRDRNAAQEERGDAALREAGLS